MDLVTMTMTLVPLGKRLLIERLDGDGREETLESGIVLPARDLSFRHGKTQNIPDTFRARVIRSGEEANKVIADGTEILVNTYSVSERTLSTIETPHGLIIELEDILAIVRREPRSAALSVKTIIGNNGQPTLSPSIADGLREQPPEEVFVHLRGRTE